MPTETFATARAQYVCIQPVAGQEACVLRYRRGKGHAIKQWVRDRQWIVPRYRTYAEAREAAERFAAGDVNTD